MMNFSKGFTLFVAVGCFVMAGVDAASGDYIWATIMAGLGVWNLHTYQLKNAIEKESSKPNVAACPPHNWGINKAGLLHCSDCGCDLRGEKK